MHASLTGLISKLLWENWGKLGNRTLHVRNTEKEIAKRGYGCWTSDFRMYLVGNYEGWIMGRNRLWVAKISGSPFDKAKIVSRLLKKSFYLYYKYNLKKIWNFDLKSFRIFLSSNWRTFTILEFLIFKFKLMIKCSITIKCNAN